MDDDVVCRVCRSDEPTLFHPCKCTGTIKYIHEQCLQMWLQRSRKTFCELCKHEFTFSPVYVDGAPKSIPLSSVLDKFGKKFVYAGRCLFRWLLAVLFLLVLVPLEMQATRRILFVCEWKSMGSILAAYSYDWLVLALSIATFTALISIRDYITTNKIGPLFDQADHHLDDLRATLQAGIEDIATAEQLLRVYANADDDDNGENHNANDGEDADAERIDEEHGGEDEWVDDDEEDEEGQLLRAHQARVDFRLQDETAALRAQQLAFVNDEENVNDANNGAVENEEEREEVHDEEGEQEEEEEEPTVDIGTLMYKFIFPPDDDTTSVWRAIGAIGFFSLQFVIIYTIIVACFMFLPYHVAQQALSLSTLLLRNTTTGTALSPVTAFLTNTTPSHTTLSTAAAHYTATCVLGYIFTSLLLSVQLTLARSLTTPLFRHQYPSLAFFAHDLPWYFIATTKLVTVLLLETFLLPFATGCLIDLCTLRLTGATISARIAFHAAHPASSLVIHWVIGLLFVFNFTAFVDSARRLLRPTLFWFIYDPDDPSFLPVKLRLTSSTLRLAVHIVCNVLLSALAVFLVFYLPARLLLRLYPSFLPLHLALHSPIIEIPIDLFILHIALPFVAANLDLLRLMESFVTIFASHVGHLLRLHPYLFGQPVGSPDYPRDNDRSLPVRIAAALVALALTTSLVSLAYITITISLGRFLLWHLLPIPNLPRLPDPYTYVLGNAALIALARPLLWILHNTPMLLQRLLHIRLVALAAIPRSLYHLSLTFISFFVLTPLLIGTIFDATLLTPFFVSLERTPLYYPVQCWSLGLVLLRVLVSLLSAFAEQTTLSRAITQVRQQPFLQLNAHLVIQRIVWPICEPLIVALTLPHLLSRAYTLLAQPQHTTALFALRYAHVLAAALSSSALVVYACLRAYQSTAKQIFNDHYLVGVRLQNRDETD